MKDELILPDPNDKEKITVAAFNSFDQVIQSGNMICTAEGKKYYHLPFWFEQVDGSWHMHFLNDLPKDLSESIVKARLGGDNPLPERPSWQEEVLYPETPDNATEKPED